MAIIPNDLSVKANVRQLLAAHNLFAKKNLGQNFLTDAHVLSKIITAADIKSDDVIIEVGPGLGVLTLQLAKHAALGRIYAIEIDPDLAAILRGHVPSNVDVINQDVLKTDLASLVAGRRFKMVANLPYYITTPVIFAALEGGLPVDTIVVMVQKEVADRILASPSSKAYGLLTLSVAYYGRASLVANVPPNSFFPRPDIHSAVIKIQVDAAKHAHINRDIFAVLTKAAFANRRKTLQNCLQAHAAEMLGLEKPQITQLLQKAGLAENVRGEALSFDDFARLTQCVQ